MCRINREGVSKRSLLAWSSASRSDEAGWSVREVAVGVEQSWTGTSRVRSTSGGQGQSARLHRLSPGAAHWAGCAQVGPAERWGYRKGHRLPRPRSVPPLGHMGIGRVTQVVAGWRAGRLAGPGPDWAWRSRGRKAECSVRAALALSITC